MGELKWSEPREYIRALLLADERRDPLRSVRTAAIVAAVVLGIRAMAQPAPDRTPPPWWPHSIVVAVAAALIFAYVLPALLSLLPSSFIILSPKGVNRNSFSGRAWQIRCWPWDKIASALMHTEEIRGRRFSLVTLIDANGVALVTLALAPKTSPEAVRDYFMHHGKSIAQSSARAF